MLRTRPCSNANEPRRRRTKTNPAFTRARQLGQGGSCTRPSPSHVRLHSASFLPLLFLNQTPSCPIPQDEDVREGEQTAGMQLSKRNSSPSFGLNKEHGKKTDITTSKTCFVSLELLMMICSFCSDQQNSYVLSAAVLCKIITCW